MEDNNFRSFVTADRNGPSEEFLTYKENIRKGIIKERVKYIDEIRKLYILNLIMLITSVLTNDTISEFLGIISSLATVVSFVCSIMLLVVYFKLGEVISEYKLVAWYSVASAVIAVITAIVGVVSIFSYPAAAIALTSLAGIAALVVSIVGTGKEYAAHGELLNGIDNEFAEKWHALWSWTIFAMIATFVFGLLSGLLLVVGLILVLACAVTTVVLTILKVVYLKRMVEMFENLEVESKSWEKEEEDNNEIIEE